MVSGVGSGGEQRGGCSTQGSTHSTLPPPSPAIAGGILIRLQAKMLSVNNLQEALRVLIKLGGGGAIKEGLSGILVAQQNTEPGKRCHYTPTGMHHCLSALT